MADTSQLKKNTPIDFSDDDPFAELTKIMGFDPREAVKKRDPIKIEPIAANAPVAHDNAQSETFEPDADFVAELESLVESPVQPAFETADYEADDFGIDLEKELLGDFQDDEPEMVVESQPVPMRAAEPVLPLASYAAPTPRVEDDFDDAISASFEDELRIDEHELLGHTDAVAEDDEFEIEDAVAEALGSVEPDGEFDPEFEPEFEQEFEIDDAMAEAFATGEPVAAQPIVPANPVQFHEEPAAAQQSLADVDMDFGDEFESEMLAGLEQTARPIPVGSASEIAAAKALDLEDELNALLGNSVARSSAASQGAPSAATPAWASRANHVAPAPAVEASAPRYYEEPPVDDYAEAEPAEMHHADVAAADEDLDELLDVMTAEGHTAEMPAAAIELPEYDHTPFSIAAADHQHAEHFDEQPHSGYAQPHPAGGYAPEVETVDVPESAVAYADDLDIPDVSYDRNDPVPAGYDDVEADYPAPYAPPVQNNAARAATPPPAARNADVNADFDALYRQVREAAGGMAYAGAATGLGVSSRMPAPEQNNDPFASLSDEDFEEELDLPSHASETIEPPSRTRGMMIAAVVGGVALLGGIGAFALSFGGSDGSDVPVVVQADNEPIKIKPENPGGTSVPNQDNKVFETMAGGSDATGAPAQEKLVSSSEEPVEIAPSAEETTAMAPLPKGEERIEPTTEAAAAPEGIVAVAPRKVKTMIVKPDGTLVPREEPAPAMAPALAPVAEETTMAAAPAVPTPAPAEPEEEIALETTATTQPAAEAETPVAAAPVEAPAEPVAEPEQQVAAVAPTAAVAGVWSMQIASQPSAESAQATYEDLAQRYGSVIGGRGVNIVKAEINGKGTYWRVRIPAETKNDAIKLCESYKAAGGNCFVSK